VRWASKVIQNSNKSDTLTYACSYTGQTFTTSELAQRLRIKPDTIRKRKTRYGWTDDEIIEGQKLPCKPATEPSPVTANGTQITMKVVDEAKRNAYTVGEQWKHTVSAACGTFELMPAHRDLSRAKDVISQLGQEKVTQIISAVVPGWRRFSLYVKEHDALTRPVPRHPNFQFVFCEHPQAAVNFAFDKRELRRVKQDREDEIMRIEYQKAHGTSSYFDPDVRTWWAMQNAKQRADFDQKL
jgi:hypothetical protein